MMGAADANITVTCVLTTYSIGGEVSGTANSSNISIVLTYYDDNRGTNPTRQTVTPNIDGTFSFASIPENKYYILEATSTTFGETCNATPTTPTLVTADVTGTRVTCATSPGFTIRFRLYSLNYESSLASINVFIGDNVVPDTSGTPSRVVNGSDADVDLIPGIFGFVADGFFYNITIEDNKYYAVTVSTTSTSQTCAIHTLNGTGGPVTDNLFIGIRCGN